MHPSRPDESRQEREPFTLALKLVFGVLGAGAASAGVWAVLFTENDGGSAALVAIGAIFLLIATVGNEMEQFSFGPWSANLRERNRREEDQQLNEGLALGLRVAEENTESGDTQAAADVREAKALTQQADLTDLADASASSYESLRASMVSGAARTAGMEALVRAARSAVERGKYAREDVVKLFREGTDGERIFGLALMQADQRLRDFSVVRDGIEKSHSAFEQYHALRLARDMLDDVRANEEQRKQLIQALDQQRTAGWIKPGTDRWQLSESIRASLASV